MKETEKLWFSTCSIICSVLVMVLIFELSHSSLCIMYVFIIISFSPLFLPPPLYLSFFPFSLSLFLFQTSPHCSISLVFQPFLFNNHSFGFLDLSSDILINFSSRSPTHAYHISFCQYVCSSSKLEVFFAEKIFENFLFRFDFFSFFLNI